MEEHFWTPVIRDALMALPGDLRDDSIDVMGDDELLHRRLLDLGEQRPADTDDASVDVQVLSVTTPTTQVLPAAQTVDLAREAEQVMAAACRRAPSPFSAFATPPTPDLEVVLATAAELGVLVHLHPTTAPWAVRRAY